MAASDNLEKRFLATEKTLNSVCISLTLLSLLYVCLALITRCCWIILFQTTQSEPQRRHNATPGRAPIDWLRNFTYWKHLMELDSYRLRLSEANIPSFNVFDACSWRISKASTTEVTFTRPHSPSSCLVWREFCTFSHEYGLEAGTNHWSIEKPYLEWNSMPMF